MSKQQDLTKVTVISIIGFSILIFTLFWLKGHKFYNAQKITAYFEDVSGLEEGAIVRWSGLRVGVVESIKPVFKSHTTKKEASKTNTLIELGQDEALKADKLVEELPKVTDSIKRKKINEEIDLFKDQSQVHIQQGIAYEQQKIKESKNHVEITLVITKKDIPFGPLSIISIVPSGLIGEQYVEISPIINRKSTQTDFSAKGRPASDWKPIFLTQEPIRYERFLKANIESSEAFRDAITKINKLLQDKDVELLIATIQDAREVVKNINKLIDNAGVLLTTTSERLEQLATSSNLLSSSVVEVGDNLNKIIGDEQIRTDLKTTTASLGIITSHVSKLLDEQGLAKDILEIGKTAKETSTELSQFIKDLRQTQEELEFPKTVKNLNSLSEKLDQLTTELNSIVADKEFKENIKVTAKKAKETSENLEKISKKYSKRFLLFRLLF
ncbi:MAG: hypothetical protein A3B68_03610 [Candidatus Melainabacteria bacterium RIFCSPHIGHO2_02_FULL_34_12]|nr:MAG: hypothetical protein A3B68_03610 [Candidatus Melainabacteria bacterium RIFCSPHIGHO2_02_FULL_34_12]